MVSVIVVSDWADVSGDDGFALMPEATPSTVFCFELSHALNDTPTAISILTITVCNGVFHIDNLLIQFGFIILWIHHTMTLRYNDATVSQASDSALRSIVYPTGQPLTRVYVAHYAPSEYSFVNSLAGGIDLYL